MECIYNSKLVCINCKKDYELIDNICKQKENPSPYYSNYYFSYFCPNGFYYNIDTLKCVKKQENNHCLYISFDKEIGNYNCIVCGLTRFQYHLVEDIDGFTRCYHTLYQHYCKLLKNKGSFEYPVFHCGKCKDFYTIVLDDFDNQICEETSSLPINCTNGIIKKSSYFKNSLK